MAGFDPNLDENKFSESVDFEGSKIIVGVFSYNGGQSKLQISREKINADGNSSFAKLGRMTKDEAEKVIPLMQKALEYL